MKYIISALTITCIIFYIFSYTFRLDEIPYEYSLNSKVDLIEKAKESELLSKKINNEIFLNLAFGMCKEDIEKYLLKLHQEKIVSEIEWKENILAGNYSMEYQSLFNTGRFYCFFEGEKLTEMQIDTTLQKGQDLIALFENKYGKTDLYFEEDCSREYHWIQGNRHLTIFQNETTKGLIIVYKDMRFEG
ncbi:MAG: hypothetical protein A2275_05345 [Bacteroidetes bacterium RIFOXYA12_FULL_35_11]|nr:MAG: hypothetical protein A2X01_19120 [Bacteroidetes bacterium GWF2_35_48]OFY74300.1 MAG: hypothetical protein A2275_05345 [Bacteroidetes bacterium RIFOXYA12_FULL_35_11]OFY94550.1 MAG: hypothetical protein A2491_09040 [Bacteroidetes bacterium RIFOXYC12_FULL_35_7]OFY95073.1 MAG: hypothetical protein A2309_05135 [Bacteroidetes bacterium RIFOXYB2_FULL_35_7]HBX50722.1 hypothetical protein [Bacteroidales bacterium]